MFKIFNGNVRGFGENPQQGIYAEISVDFRKHLRYFKGAKLAVFMAITLHADAKGRSSPSLHMLETETGYDGATISQALTELCKLEVDGKRVLLAVQERTKGKFVKNRYLIFPSTDEIAEFNEVARKPRRSAKSAGKTESGKPSTDFPNTAEPNTVSPNTENAVDGIDPVLEKPSLENNTSAKPAIAVSPAAELPQPIDPIEKREGSEPDKPAVREELQSPLLKGSPLTAPDGFTIAYSDYADGRHAAHLFKSTVKQPSKCVKCHADLATWSQVAGDLHTYEPCCDWQAVDPTWSTEVKDALAKLCKKDWSIPAHKKGMGGCLNAISQREPVTLEKLRRFYSNWYKCIYKGIQGNAPEPYEVTSKWIELTESDDCKEKPTNGNKRYQPDDYLSDPIFQRD